MILAGANGYELTAKLQRGSTDIGTIYLEKPFTQNQLLTYVILNGLKTWMVQGDFEKDSDYITRTDKENAQLYANDLATTFFMDWTASHTLSITYDRKAQSFTIDPVIGDSIHVPIGIDKAPDFQDQFPNWAQTNLTFVWFPRSRKAQVASFKMPFKVRNGKKMVGYSAIYTGNQPN
jgi:hypothetical protein